MDMDGSGGQDSEAHDEVDQTEDDRSNRDKSINNQAQPRKDTAKAGGNENR